MADQAPTETSQLRLLYLTGELGHGGSERQLYLLLKHLDPARCRATVVVFNPTPYPVLNEALRAASVDVIELPPEIRGIRKRLAYLRRLCRRLRPHVLHSWSVHDNAYAAVAGRLAGVPLRWGSLRGSLHSEAIRSLPALYRFLCLRGVQRLLVNSEALRDQLLDASLGGSRIAVLPNGVELPPADVQPADLSGLGIDTQAPVVGILGNLRRVKNQQLFVQAMAEVIRHHPDARGVIVGQPLPSEPDLPAELQAEIDGLGLHGKVLLAGFRSDVTSLLARFDVMALTSHSEGQPNAILEAMAAGTPVVATSVGGIPELLGDGDAGLLVPAGDADALAQAIEGLLLDPTRARRLGQAGRLRVQKRHACSHAAAHLERLYRGALRARGITVDTSGGGRVDR